MNREIVDAINDLTRVIIAVNGKFETKAEAVRRLLEFSIPPVRIAAILAMEPKAVHTVIARMKQKAKNDKGIEGGETHGQE